MKNDLNTFNIRFEGNELKPSKLKEKLGLPIEILAEFGEIASNGRYKGKAYPYGMGLLEISSKKNEINDLIRECSQKIKEWKNVLQECAVDEIFINIGISKNISTEIALSKDLMSELILMNVNVEIHTIEKEEKIENRDQKIKQILNILHKGNEFNVIYSNLIKHRIIYNDEALYTFLYFMFSDKFSKSINDNLIQIEGLTKLLREHDFEE